MVIPQVKTIVIAESNYYEPSEENDEEEELDKEPSGPTGSTDSTTATSVKTDDIQFILWKIVKKSSIPLYLFFWEEKVSVH